jgi:hypothetical protein
MDMVRMGSAQRVRLHRWLVLVTLSVVFGTANSQAAQDPLVAAAGKALVGLRLQLSLNEDGELIGLANESEVAPKLQAALDMMVKDVLARPPEDQRGSGC